MKSHAPSTGRGRPRLNYRVSPAADSRWGVTGPYERLSLLLTEMLKTGDAAVDVGRRSVRPERGAEPPTTIRSAWSWRRWTAEASIRSSAHGAGAVEVVLRTCPFATAALVDPDSVCSLHLGIAQGVADLTDGRVVIDELVPHDPRRANCRLLVHREDPEAV